MLALLVRHCGPAMIQNWANVTDGVLTLNQCWDGVRFRNSILMMNVFSIFSNITKGPNKAIMVIPVADPEIDRRGGGGPILTEI